MNAVVSWPGRRRALVALLVPVFLALAYYARVTTNEPSEGAARFPGREGTSVTSSN